MKRKALWVYLAAMLLLASCGGNQAMTTESATKTVQPETGETETETEKLTSGLEAVDYDGTTVTFLTYKNSDYQNSQMDILAESMTGEHVNDAVFNRNKSLEEKYNINVASTGDKDAGSAGNMLKSAVQSDDDAYDICFLTSATALQNGFAGHLLPMNAIPYIDVTRSWWNAQTCRESSILGVNYFYIGDINLDTWTQSYVTYFNKQLAKDYNIPNLYETVKAGNWTFDELTRLTRLVYKDVNGNGQYDENDLYGLAACSVCVDCFWISSGVRMIAKTAEDGLELSFDERFYALYERMHALLEAPEMLYCAMEVELQEYLDTYERTHDYDEYHYDLDDIEHDPYVLISAITALHGSEWTVDEVGGILELLFEKQYILTEIVETETRYRTETRNGERPARDPDTGEYLYDEDGWLIWEEYTYQVDVPYTYYICTVELENFNLSHVPVYIMSQDWHRATRCCSFRPTSLRSSLTRCRKHRSFSSKSR